MSGSFHKLDKSLISKVSLQNKNETALGCLVFVREFDKARTELEQMFSKAAIAGEFPFIGAIGLNLPMREILRLAEFVWVDYISSQVTVSALLNESRVNLGIDSLHGEGLLGQGVSVAVIDTGISPHLDFMLGKNRIAGFVDLISGRQNIYDDNGHGTFIAGILAGSGLVSNGYYCGVAPKARLLVIKALDNTGQTETFTILKAMQYIYDHRRELNIKVVCMSFGSVPLPKNDPLIKGAESLWDAGIVVVCAGGNDGPAYGTIKSPGASRKIITVGASEKKDNFKVADFSSRGPVNNIVKPDLLAPGVDIISTMNGTHFYGKMSGTSVATPFVAGAAALMVQKYPHYNPNQIKGLLLYSAIKLPYDSNTGGRGLVNPRGAMDY